MKQLNLVLHKGARVVTEETLRAVPTPASTSTWRPVPHIQVVELVRESLARNGYGIMQEKHALLGNGDRYFGMMQIVPALNAPDEYGMVLGLRGSFDQSLARGLVAGSGVFVCDNLSFSGEVKFTRKQTTHIMDDLPRMVDQAITRLRIRYEHQDKRFEAYKGLTLTDRDANDLIIQALEADAIMTRNIKPLLAEWRKPSHVEFTERNAWSLFNCTTEVLKGSALAELPARTEALHLVLDRATQAPSIRDVEEPELPFARATPALVTGLN